MKGRKVVNRLRLYSIFLLFAPFILTITYCTRGPSLATCQSSKILDSQTKQQCTISYQESEYLDNYNPFYIDNWIFGNEDLIIEEELSEGRNIYTEADSYR